MEMTTHWHVAGGLAGYGPNGEDGYAYAVTWRELADLLLEGLQRAAEYVYETAQAAAEGGDKAQAWDLVKECEELERLAQNFDNERREAPAYPTDDAWDAEIQRMVESNFPYYYDHTVNDSAENPSARLALYAWPCTEGADCEHVEDDDDPRGWEG